MFEMVCLGVGWIPCMFDWVRVSGNTDMRIFYETQSLKLQKCKGGDRDRENDGVRTEGRQEGRWGPGVSRDQQGFDLTRTWKSWGGLGGLRVIE